MSHDIRVHRPGESAVCTQCSKTAQDRWLEIPHHEADTVEVKVWCRECLLTACGIDPATGEPLPENPPEGCPNCDGAGKTKTCANCVQPSVMIKIGGCNHFCWSCQGSGKAR